MKRPIGLLCTLSLFLLTGVLARRSRISEACAISNWSAPLLWKAPVAGPLGRAHTEALGQISAPLPFVALTPCRIADTRGNGFAGEYGPPSLIADATRAFTISGRCGIPASAAAVSFNFAALNVGASGDLRVYPSGTAAPVVSTINYDSGTPNIANAAVVPLGTGGAITVQADAASIDLIIDVNGYYDGSSALQKSLGRRAVLDQFWTPRNDTALGLTTVGIIPYWPRSDGADLWVPSSYYATISRVRASDGRLLETWTGATSATAVLIAMGRVFVTGNTGPGRLYEIDPTQTPGEVTTVASNLGDSPAGIAFDGARIWTANGNHATPGGSVSIVTPGASLPWETTTATAGFSIPAGVIFDGSNVWVTDIGAGTLLKLDSSGGIIQTIVVGAHPVFPIFDGTNIWVPNRGTNSVSVVRASSGSVLATLTGNGLNSPQSAAFDGERVLVTNFGGSSVSLWRASDLSPLGSPTTGTSFPFGACSDGLNFWVTLENRGQLARF